MHGRDAVRSNQDQKGRCVMTVGTAQTGTPRAPSRLGFGWVPGALVAIAVAAVAAAAFYFAFSDDGGATGTAAETATPAAAAVIYDQDLVMARLANQGYIPRAAVDWEAVELKRLVNMGLVPAAALESATPESLFTQVELLEIDLANRGIIPTQAVDWETIEMKRLVNMGLIPRQALED